MFYNSLDVLCRGNKTANIELGHFYNFNKAIQHCKPSPWWQETRWRNPEISVTNILYLLQRKKRKREMKSENVRNLYD